MNASEIKTDPLRLAVDQVESADVPAATAAAGLHAVADQLRALSNTVSLPNVIRELETAVTLLSDEDDRLGVFEPEDDNTDAPFESLGSNRPGHEE
jgi:hypothetical protein